MRARSDVCEGREIMAEVKAAVKATAKTVAKETEVKAAETKTAKTAEAVEVKETVAKAETAKKTVAKKETEKKTTTKKATTTKKTEVKAAVNFQFAGKSYTSEDFVKIAKDVWKYDLGKKPSDFKTVELYVKPEESQAYYVINGEVTGSFMI